MKLQVDETCGLIKEGRTLGDTEYARVTDSKTGAVRCERGPRLLFPKVNEDINGPIAALNLRMHEYVVVQDGLTGKETVHCGEQLLFPGPHDVHVDASDSKRLRVFIHSFIHSLRRYYVWLLWRAHETRRLYSRRMSYDCNRAHTVQHGVNVDRENAVLVRNRDTGQLQLITEPQLFIPSASQVSD
jgi:hypothetical protein